MCIAQPMNIENIKNAINGSKNVENINLRAKSGVDSFTQTSSIFDDAMRDLMRDLDAKKEPDFSSP